MSGTFTLSDTETFTLTHARHIAAKVATDLLRLQRFHGLPSTEWINDYETEIITLLKGDYVDTVTYGFKRNGSWVEAVRYRAVKGSGLVTDDDPGRLRPGTDVTGTSFGSSLAYSRNWYALGEAERERIRRGLPFQRATQPEPGVENGVWSEDLSYSAGGHGLRRARIVRL